MRVHINMCRVTRKQSCGPAEIDSLSEICEITGRTGGLSPQITVIPGFRMDWASLTDYSTMNGSLVMEIKERY